MFIYYSFASLDELIELYAVYFKREKGALGLLFEMNYFLGVAVAIYITVFIYSSDSVVPTEYSSLFTYVMIQAYIMYAMIFLSFMVMLCMCQMNRKVKRRQGKKVKTDDDPSESDEDSNGSEGYRALN